MLSVSESAELLQVSPARVRALISEGALPARKVGRAWVLREEDVMDRIARRPCGGRPRRSAPRDEQPSLREPARTDDDLHDLFLACRKSFSARPDALALAAAETPEEQSFYLAVSDFFIQQRQNELVRMGAF